MTHDLKAQSEHHKHWRNRIASFLLTALVAACGGGGSPPAATTLPVATTPISPPTVTPPVPIPETAQTIGATGGTVAGPDGVRLAIPPAALESDVTFRIARDGAGAPTLPSGIELASAIYAITPHGQTFEASTSIEIPVSSALASGRPSFLMKASPGGRWAVIGSGSAASINGATTSLRAGIESLSYFALGVCANNLPPSSLFGQACPSGHQLSLELLINGTSPVPISQDTTYGAPVPVVLITTRETLTFRITWTRPSGTNRTDTLDTGSTFNGNTILRQAGITFASAAPLFLDVNQDSFSQVFTVDVDPARVSGASRPNGVVRRIFGQAKYTVVGPGNVGSADWEFNVWVPIQVRAIAALPTLNTQPADASVEVGQSSTFTVAASVTPTTPLSYQWSRRANANATFAAITGATTPGYSVASAQLADNGAQFQVEVCAGPTRCVTSTPATLTVSPVVVVPPPPPANTVPSFSAQPGDLSVLTAQTASFTAVATGVPPPQIKWQRAAAGSTTFSDVIGVPACATTNPSGGASSVAATCTVGPQTQGDSGLRYRAVALNAAAPAGVNSSFATVTVSAAAVAPSITLQPTPQTTTVGANAVFTVGATGTAPLNYLWKINGNNLTPSFTFGSCVGSFTQSAASATLSGLSAGCDGLAVSVMVTNGVGPGVSSSPATLTVNSAVVALTATQIVAGQEWSMVLRPDRSVWAWGQLHRTDGTVQSANLLPANQAMRPVRMYPAVLSDVHAISGWHNSFWALKGTPGTTASRVLHWGTANVGADGRGGDGNGSIGSAIATRYNEAAPVEVLERVNNVPQPVDRVCAIAGGPGRLTMIRAINSVGATTDCNAGSAKTVWFVGSLRSRGYESTGVAFAMPGLPTNSPPAVIFNGQTTSGSPGLAIALDDGRVFGLGDNPFGGFGVVAGGGFPIGDQNGPVLLPASWGNARSFGMSFTYSLFVVRADGSVMTSGEDRNGEMGLGSAPGGTVAGPVPVLAESCLSLPCASALTGVTAIASTNAQVTLALKNGQILGWGQRNTSGLRGLNDTIDQPFPRAVPSAVSGFTALSASNIHALVIGPGNVVYAWGSGLRGALGDGVNGGTRTEPMMVTLP